MGLFSKRQAPQGSRVTAELVEGGRVQGWTDVARFENGNFRFRGWMLHPIEPIDQVKLTINGRPFANTPIMQRPDVATHYPLVPHAAGCGWDITATFARALEDKVLHLVAEGWRQNKCVAKYESYTLADGDADRVAPSASLMKRVSGTQDAGAFGQMGITAAMDLMTAANQHMGKVGKLLDYGCGSGRVAHFLLKLFPEMELAGCDIDEEAIAWDNEHLKKGAFKVMRLDAPLPYEDNSFDAAVAVSVMTHLTLAEQNKWLAEIRRVLRPGGLFLPSMHGAIAAHYVDGMVQRLETVGIVDQIKDPALDGVAPSGYYRSTFMLPSYVRQEWSKTMKVVEIRQAGCGGFQDLVVLKR